MKILVTGLPRIGKSTLVESVLANIKNKQGFSTGQITENGQRVGFNLVTAANQKAVFAHINLDTPYRLGRYAVNVSVLDNTIVSLFNFTPDQLLYVDEIAPMELFSPKFKSLVNTYLESPNDFFGAISLISDAKFIVRIRQAKNNILFTLTPENRQDVQLTIELMLQSRGIVKKLPLNQYQKFIQLAANYARLNQFLQLKKLFNNALSYLSANKYTFVDKDNYTIIGNTGTHWVSKSHQQWHCDCDLFNGRGDFINHSGECSHIQVVKLLVP